MLFEHVDVQVVLMDKLELASDLERAFNAVVLVDMRHKDIKYKTLAANLQTVIGIITFYKMLPNKYC